MSSHGSSPGVIRFGVFDVDLRSGELRKHGIRIKLQVQPFQVLQVLLENAGQVVTREELHKKIWPADTFVDFDHGLNNAVKKLREALGDDAGNPRFIETLSKRGYRFIGAGEQDGNSALTPSGAAALSTKVDSIRPLPSQGTVRSDVRLVGLILLLSAAVAIVTLGVLRGRLFGPKASRVSANASTEREPTGPQHPVPVIDDPLIPDTVAARGPSFTLLINGTGFVPGSVVNWDGLDRVTTFVNSSQLRANIPASDIAHAGTASVTVINPRPGGGSSNAIFFSFGAMGYAPSLAKTDFSVGLQPDSVAVGDFNGDGKLDLAVANARSGNVSILLGEGDGTFYPAVNYAAGQGPFSQLAIGDFNGDGKLDLVVSNFGSNNVSVLLGNGDGTFRAAANYNVGKNPSSVAVADVNGDGNLDLVVANQNCKGAGSSPPCEAATVSILLGNGDGTFQQHKDFSAGQNINWVVVGDFNGDGKLDLAVVNGGASVDGSAVLILLGNGDGTFHASARYPMGANGVSAAAADLNGDGKLDLAVVDNMGWVSVFLGNGDGTFQARADYYTSASFPWGSIGIGDFSGDGTVDIAVANSGSNSVTILFGNGNGTFQPFGARFDTGLCPLGVAVGDFNGNGRLDLAVAARYSNAVSILLQ